MSVEVSEASTSITLKFVYKDKYNIYRKLYDDTKWGEPIEKLDTPVSSWKDQTIQ